MPTLEELQEEITNTVNQTPDTLDSPPEAVAENQGYSYTRTDGTVEYAASAEDARKLCPVLGGMSLEQANVMLELSAIGKAILADQNLKQPEPKEPKQAEPSKIDKVSSFETRVSLNDSQLSIDSLSINTAEILLNEDAVTSGITLPERQNLKSQRPTIVLKQADEKPVLINTSDFNPGEPPKSPVIQEHLVEDRYVEAINIVELRSTDQTDKPIEENIIHVSDGLIPIESSFITDELPQIEKSDELPLISTTQPIEDLTINVDDTEPEYPTGITDVGNVDFGETSKLDSEILEDHLHMARGLIREVSNVSLESFEPEELTEIDIILEKLLAEIKLNIDVLKLDAEEILDNETLVNICLELQEKLCINNNEKFMRQFIEQLVQQYRVIEAKFEVLVDIDRLNKLGTREYMAPEDKHLANAWLDFSEQSSVILYLGGMSILRAA